MVNLNEPDQIEILILVGYRYRQRLSPLDNEGHLKITKFAKVGNQNQVIPPNWFVAKCL